MRRPRRSFIIERARLPKRARSVAPPDPVATLKTARLRARFAKLITALEFQGKRK